MSIWEKLGEFVSRISTDALAGVIEAVRTIFEGDPETRRRVAFSIAMIALSAKMAKADGVVTQDEVRAFDEIFSVPQSEQRNVRRLYKLAMEDVAGYETYAKNLASLCGSGEPACPALEDILDGLFHIAKADGVIHDKEAMFLQHVAQIFGFGSAGYDRILARHVDLGTADPYTVLGVDRSMPFSEIRARYRQLARENHPDKMFAHGLPPEFVAIANDKLAAINHAYERIERAKEDA